MITSMLEYYLWLLQLMGAGNPKSHRLIERYGDPKSVYEAMYNGSGRKFLAPSELKRLDGASLENSESILDLCEKNDIKIITLNDEKYPHSLKDIYNPPIVLFYQGNIGCLDSEICISAVGARDITEYSAKVTRRTCIDLAKLGVVLVSGMAFGVDKVVHQAAVDVKGKTVGVLACGMAVDYPKGSASFRKEICSLGGACISELLPTETASKAYFHKRNRIISALGVGVIIFQAGIKSGSLITANHALQQGKDIFCIPPANLFDARYCGVVSLLRDGAIPIFNYLDIVNYYFSDFTDKLDSLNSRYNIAYDKQFIFREGKQEREVQSSHGYEDKNEEKHLSRGERAALRFNFEQREPEMKRIFDYLCENGTAQLEILTDQCNIPPEDISLYLVDMEMEGLIEASAGNNYSVVK